MSKKRSWLGFIKRFFFAEKHYHVQQKQKINRIRWMFGKQLKRTKTLPSIAHPSPTRCQPEDEKQSKCEEHQDETITNEAKRDAQNQNVAAIKIQAVYRGYLARKALRALKGFVRLQAIIRGRAVRRQAMTTLRCLQSIAKIQSEVCAKRCQMIRCKHDGQFQLQHLQSDNLKLEAYKQRRKDNELLTKEEQILRSKKEKAYPFIHRHSADSDDGISQGRLRYWLDHYANEDVWKKDNKNSIDGLTIFDRTTLPRRSYHKHKKQHSYSEDSPLSSSLVRNLPTYMASTESAKAKIRSLSSSPRLRHVQSDAYSDINSPFKLKLSLISSINSEATYSDFSNKSSTFSSFQQKSPSIKGVSVPIRSNKS